MIQKKETNSYLVYEHQNVLITIYKKIGYSIKWYSNTIRVKYDYTKNNILNEFTGSPKYEIHSISSLDDKNPEKTFIEEYLSEFLRSNEKIIDTEIRRYSKKIGIKEQEEKYFCKPHGKHKVDKDWEI